jgi:protein involved in polysaccharide export with SLBB domain
MSCSQSRIATKIESKSLGKKLSYFFWVAVVSVSLCASSPAQNAGGVAGASSQSSSQSTGAATSASQDDAPEQGAVAASAADQADETAQGMDTAVSAGQTDGSAQGTGTTASTPGSVSSQSTGATAAHAPAQAAQAVAEGQNGQNAANAKANSLRTHAVEDHDEPREIQMPDPYKNVPALHDLYTQIPSAGGTLKRFGSDAFLFGSGNVNELPMDVPVGPDYVLGPGDNLIVNMWGGESSRLDRTIDRQGQIALPEVGTVMINGLTMSEAQNTIQSVLSKQFQNEHVELSLGRVRTVRVYVVGDVQRPGAYDVSSLSTPLNALYAAGGPTSRGSLRVLEHYRGNRLVQKLDLYDFLLHGVRSTTDRLLPGDTVLVPAAGPQVTVEGMVHRPAIYELNGERTLGQVLKLSGGVLITASLKQINVSRIVANQKRTMVSVPLAGNKAEIDKQLADFKVQSGDDVVISQILPYNTQAVYLEGHVYRPGRYPYHEGMTIADLLHSYRDVMPEPANHGELIRLVPPDFHPETISFSLPDILIGNDSIPLQPFDTVRVFGRYEVDAPTVSIFGEVLRPGKYPMSEGMTAAGLVRMAGGFRRSAYRQEADLSSYAIQNGQKVLIGYSVVEIQKALDGDKSADVLLKPGDAVGIRQLTGWNDIGAAITISGEVKYAGTYGIEDGERLSSVLQRAGGFREDAFPQGAVLERVEVRNLEEVTRQQLIHRIETSIPNVQPSISTTGQTQQGELEAMQQQREQVLTALRNQPSTGRVVIRISLNISQWENTPADIVLRAGDTLVIPKRADFVLVSGQVYNATGITYSPGKNAGWYLRQAGGATRYGDKRQIFILRADGSVVSHEKSTMFSAGVLDTRMYPGDSVIVPEKVIGGTPIWQNLIGVAQIASSLAFTGAVAGVF